MAQHLGAIGEIRLSSWESLQKARSGEERRREVDSPPVSQLGFHRLLHLCIYCLYATYTEIHGRYFRLTPFVCEYNNNMFQGKSDMMNAYSTYGKWRLEEEHKPINSYSAVYCTVQSVH